MTYYKWLSPNRQPAHGGTGQWPEPGVERRVEGQIEPCKNGLHLCAVDDLPYWIGVELWEVTIPDGAMVVRDENKTVVDRASLGRQITAWTRIVAAEFADRCARRASTYASDARYAASYASYASDAARCASFAATYASYAASYASDAASYARYAATYARDAASYAGYASDAASYASDAGYAARDASETEKKSQVEDLRELLGI